MTRTQAHEWVPTMSPEEVAEWERKCKDGTLFLTYEAKPYRNPYRCACGHSRASHHQGNCRLCLCGGFLAE